MGLGPRVYLVGCLLPSLIAGLQRSTDPSTAEQLDEAIRIALYISDLTIARMGYKIVHDWEQPTSGGDAE